MTVAYHIREARESDVPAVIALFGMLDDLHRTGAPHQFRGSSQAPRSAQFVLALIRDLNGALIVAEAGARIVGHLAVTIESVADRGPLIPRRYAQVQDLIVTTSMRRLGIGKALVQAAERWALARGVNSWS